MKVRQFFKELDSEREEHCVDRLVEERVGMRAARRKLAKLSNAIVRSLGLESNLWFDYEQEKGAVSSAREEAYFDVGVEHGVAVAHAEELAEPRRDVKRLAEHLVREAIAAGLAREDAAAAAAQATWALLGRLRVARSRRR